MGPLMTPRTWTHQTWTHQTWKLRSVLKRHTLSAQTFPGARWAKKLPNQPQSEKGYRSKWRDSCYPVTLTTKTEDLAQKNEKSNCDSRLPEKKSTFLAFYFPQRHASALEARNTPLSFTNGFFAALKRIKKTFFFSFFIFNAR